MANGAMYLLFAGISLLTAGVAMLLVERLIPLVRRGAATAPVAGSRIDVPRRYEFREGYLMSPIAPDDAFLPGTIERAGAFDVLSRTLAHLHPDLPDRMQALRTRAEAFLLIGTIGDDNLSVSGRTEEDRLVLSIAPADEAHGRQTVDAAALAATQAEVADLRQAVDVGAAVIWKMDAEATITWANAAYFALAERLAAARGDAVGWPVQSLFADQLEPLPSEGTLRRCQLILEGAEDPLWFEVSAHRQDDGSILCAAHSIERLVASEGAMRSFVQTLSKTFASLPIGLAVFDRKRELVLFNPALVTHSTLEPEFLSKRPHLVSFLDQLRDRQRMPEPRDYRSWRDEIARLEQGAEDGTYQELWTLPGGETLRVIGRPHPDGAVAFMFEDISQEVSLTRRFRADLDLYQAVIDDTPSAVAVFGPEGALKLCNDGYAQIWGAGADTEEAAATLIDATRLWSERCEPSGVWGDIRDFAARRSDRSAWVEAVTRTDGMRLACRVTPLKGGATAVRFIPLDEDLTDPLAELMASPPAAVTLTPAAIAGMAETPQIVYEPPTQVGRDEAG